MKILPEGLKVQTEKKTFKGGGEDWSNNQYLLEQHSLFVFHNVIPSMYMYMYSCLCGSSCTVELPVSNHPKCQVTRL